MNPANPAGSGNTITLPGGVLGAGDSWQALVGVDYLFCAGTLTIDLGATNLRINPAGAPPSVPEPSTISLFALGGTLLRFKRRCGQGAA